MDWLDRIAATRGKSGAAAHQGGSPAQRTTAQRDNAAQASSRQQSGGVQNRGDWLSRIDAQRGSAGQSLIQAAEAEQNRLREEALRLQRERELRQFGDQPASPSAGAGVQAPAVYQPSAFASSYKAAIEAAQNKYGKTTRPLWDRDSDFQGKVAEQAVSGMEQAVKDQNPSLYAQHLQAYYNAAGNIQQNQKEALRKLEKESPAEYYAYTMSAEQIEQKAEEAKAAVAAAEEAKRQAIAANKDWRPAYQGGGVVDTSAQDEEIRKAKEREEVWEAALVQRKSYEILQSYQALTENPDFEEKSRFKTTKHGDPKSEMGVLVDSGYDDVMYDAINGDPTAQWLVRDKQLEFSFSTAKYDNWFKLPDENKAIYNYLHKTQGKEAAENYLEMIAEYNVSPIDAATYGFGRGLGVSSVLETAVNLLGEGNEMNEFLKMEGTAQKQHKTAYGVGNMAGNIALMAASGQLAGSAAKTLGLGGAKVCAVSLGGKTFAVYTTPITTKMATSAMTFALTDAVQNMGSVSAGRITVGEYMGSIGKGAAGGAAGSLASWLVDSKMAALLADKGWMTAFGEYTRKVAASAAFSTANIETKQILSSEKMSADECGRQLMTSFLYNIISSGLQTISETQEYKAGMDALKDNIADAYNRMSTDGLDPAQKAELAQNVILWTQQLKASINSMYLPGQQQYVNDMNAALDGMIELMDGYGKFNVDWASQPGAGNLIGNGETGLTIYQPQGTGPTVGQTQNDMEMQIRAGFNDGLQLAGQNPINTASQSTETATDISMTPSFKSGAGAAQLPAADTEAQSAVPAIRPAEEITVPGPERDDGSRDLAQPAPAEESGTGGQIQTVYEKTKAETAKQARGLSDEELAVMAENVEENLAETRDGAAPSEVAVMEGQRDALREEIRLREAVSRNGERMQAAIQRAEVRGVDWNDGRIAEAQNDMRADVGIGPYEENGGQIARTAEQEGLNYGRGTKSAADGGQRDAGLDTREQTGSLGESTGGPVARSTSTQERNELKNYVKALGDQRASARDVGIRNGTTNATNVLIDVEALTGSLRDRYTALREKAGKAGLRLDFVMGKMEIRMPEGKVSSNNGVFQIDADGTPHLFVQADSKMYSVEQIYEHEMFHAIVAGNKALWQDILQHLKETHTPEEIRAMVEAYVSAYDGCYNNQQNAEDLYLEELMADVYAEMQRGGGQQSAARELAGETAQRFAGDIENARQNRAGIDNRNGPGTRFSIKNMQNLSWEEQLRTHRHSDTLVVQNDVDSFLNGRVNNKPLAVPVSIVTKAQSGKDTDHSVSNPTIQQLPQGMKNAVYVIDSKSRNSIVYVTNLRENKKLLIVAFAKDRHFDNDDIHQATSIHLRENPNIMLEKLGPEDKVYIRKNELDKVPGSPLQLGTLKAQVEFIDDIVTEDGKVVKRENDAVDWEGNLEQRLSVSDETNAEYERVEHVSPREIVPRNDVEKDRMEEVRERAANTTEWQGRPMLAYERAGSLYAITGSHRLAVARLASYDVDAVILRENELADLEQYLQEETYWDLDDFLERMDEADQADYLNKAVEKGYDSLREASSLMNAEVEWNDARYSRFSHSEDADGSWGVDWIGKENGLEERDTTSSASRSEVPFPQGEGLETGERRSEARATAPEAPRNDKTGSAARTDVPSSVTAEAVTPSPQGEGFAAQAREKKVEMAERLGIDGLKSRIKTAEERLKMWKAMQSSGLVAQDAKSVQELKNRIADAQETLEIFRGELEKKQAAKKAAASDKALKAERKQQRAAEKKALVKEAELKDNKPRQARREFRQDALNLFSVQAGKRQTLGNIINSFADRLIAQGSVSEADRAELFRQLYEAGVEIAGPADDTMQDIRDFVKTGRIYVPQEVRNEFGDDWIAFNQQAWGNQIYFTRDVNDRGADSWNAELAEAFPGSFDAGETDARTILENIVELAEEGKGEHVTIAEMMRRNQAETGVTVDQQMDELESKLDRLIDTFAQKARIEAKTAKRGMMQLVKERQYNREQVERQAQRRREIETRNEVMKQIQQLNRMRKKSAPEIQKQIDAIIGNLDTMSRSISPEGMENLQALERKYSEAAEDPNFLGNPYVEARLARLSQIQLDSLEISDVIELGRTISALVKTVTEDKRLLTVAREKEIDQAAREVNREIASSAGSKGGKLREFLGNEHLSPTRELQRLGGWVRGGMMEQLSRSLEDGGTRRMEYMRQATRIFDDFLSDKANQEWLRKAQGKDAEWITITAKVGVTGEDVLSGEAGPKVFKDVTFELTPMMRVGLLMHSKNKDNLRHIDTGGIVIPNKECYLKGNLADADAKGLRVKIQPEIVRAIVKDCTAQEKAFAALLEQYYDGFSKEKINEVSMLIDGFERAGGDHYYGIKVSRKFLAALPEQIQKNMSLESIGSIVNERVHAGNPIILEDASTALKDHIDLISKYYGYTAPIRDFNAVMNYTFHFTAETKGGGEYVANAFSGSVKETLQAKWGAGAQKYVDELLADLQQSSGINETAAAFLAKLRGNLAGASLMFNPAVAISQTASLPGAIQVVGFDGMVAGLKPEKVDMHLVEKYTPILWYRNQGNSTQELGDYMARQGLEGKLPWMFNWIQKMDSWTIRRLWAASEYRVSKDTDMAPGSKAQIDAGEDAYYQEVARVFQRAVYDTQPNYSEMQRPAILRTDKDIVKFLTMYKTVPLQYYNMMYEAVGRLKADKARFEADGSAANKAQFEQSRSFAVRTFTGVLGANVVYVVMKAAVKGLLGGKDDRFKDEEGKFDWGKTFGGLGKDLIETYAGSVICGSDLLGFIEKQIEGGNYYNRGVFEISALSAVNQTIARFQDLRNKIVDQDLTGGLGAIKELAKQLAMDTGIPANNIETYLLGTAKWFAPEWVDRYENFFDEFERADLKGEHGRDLRAAISVIMDNRTDGLKDETIDELMRLWEIGQNAVIPSAIPSKVSVDGEDVEIKGADKAAFRERWGQVIDGSLEKLLASDAYQAADDAGKAKLISKLYEYARQQAAAAVTDKGLDNWVTFGQACEAAGIPLDQYLSVASVDKSKLKDMDGEALDNAIQARMEFRVGELDEKTLDELGRLYAAGGTGAIPADVPTSVSVSGEENKLTAEERVAWLQAWKRTAGENLEALMASKAYAEADDTGKAKLISALYDMARASASSEVVSGYAPDKWITTGLEASEQGVPLDEYITFHYLASKEAKEKEKIQLLMKQDWSDHQKETVWTGWLANDTQISKYENLKNGGASWKDAMGVMDIGGDATEGLTEAQAAVYQQKWDSITGKATKALMQTNAYKNANNEGKEALVDKLNTYASAVAKAEALKTTPKDSWVKAGVAAEKAGVSLEQYIVFTEQLGKIDGKDEKGESVDGLERHRGLELLNSTGWTDKQKEMVFLESGMTDTAAEEKEKALRSAGLTWGQTSTVMGTLGSNTEKAYAIINSGATSNVVYKALEVYLDGSSLRTAQTGINYSVNLKYWVAARKEADANGNGSIDQKEATAYIDDLNLSWDEKAYLWQMVCYSSKWMKNPFSTTFGKEIWHDLHPEG